MPHVRYRKSDMSIVGMTVAVPHGLVETPEEGFAEVPEGATDNPPRTSLTQAELELLPNLAIDGRNASSGDDRYDWYGADDRIKRPYPVDTWLKNEEYTLENGVIRIATQEEIDAYPAKREADRLAVNRRASRENLEDRLIDRGIVRASHKRWKAWEVWFASGMTGPSPNMTGAQWRQSLRDEM